MIKTNKIYGLSVVEILVTISLLAILALISFMSFLGYSKDTRDAIRVSNLDLINNSLITIKTTAGRYPTPDDSKDITYLGEVIWRHGIIGEEVSAYINSVPFVDPKYRKQKKEKPLYFSYSTLKDSTKFQVGTILENASEELSFVGDTYASNEKAYSVGNFNGFYVKVFVGGETHIISVPSLIINDSNEHELVLDEQNTYFSVNGTSSLPGKYFFRFPSSQYIYFTPKLLYKGSNCGVQTDKNIVDFISNFKDSFNIEPFVSLNYYDEIFADYNFLTTNFHNFEELKILGYKINKSLECDLNSFKTSNLFPVTYGDEDGTFDFIADGTNINDTKLYKYEGDGNAIVESLIGSGGTNGLHIYGLGYDRIGTLSYKTFSYNPIKVDFDYRATFGHIDSSFKFFVDGIEILSKDKDSVGIDSYSYFEGTLLGIGFHEFEWILTKFEDTQAELFLDNMSVYCVGGGLGC